MIIAKTRLKKIPNNCRECAFSARNHWAEERHCRITMKDCPWIKKPSGNFAYGKAPNCPLVEVE